MKKKILSLFIALTTAITSIFCVSVTAGAAKFDMVKELKNMKITEETKLDDNMCVYFGLSNGAYTVFVSGLNSDKAAKIADLCDQDGYMLSVAILLDSGVGIGCEDSVHVAYVAKENFSHDNVVKKASFSKTGSKYKVTVDVSSYIHKELKAATRAAVSIRAVNTATGEKAYYNGKKVMYAPFTSSDTSSTSLKDLKFGSIGDKTFTGGAQKPLVIIKDGTYTLQKDKDYSLSYSNNIKIGTAVITIKGKGSYTGTKKIGFRIVPETTKVKSVSASYDKLTVYWDDIKGADTYHVYYSTNMGASYKEGGSAPAGTGKCTIYCPIGSQYLVKIRTSTTIDGKTYYSKYSKELQVTNIIMG